jgi:hypothetical protein
MEDINDRTPVKHGFKLLGIKILLGAAAAIVAMGMMRIFGGGEILVALLIGLVPGLAERSWKKLFGGAALALIGYSVGARIGYLVAKSASGVPLGHWAVTGAFIGMTAGIRKFSDQSSSSRIVGTVFGFILGFIFGIMGDIGGFFTVPANGLPLFYYLREVSLLCAGIFINLGAALAAMLALAIANRSRRRAMAAAQETQA